MRLFLYENRGHNDSLKVYPGEITVRFLRRAYILKHTPVTVSVTTDIHECVGMAGWVVNELDWRFSPIFELTGREVRDENDSG